MTPGAGVSFGLLSRIVNRVQGHACTQTYCLRKYKLPDGKWSDDMACRFYYPRIKIHHSAPSIDQRTSPHVHDTVELLTVSGTAFDTRALACEECRRLHRHGDYDSYGIDVLPPQDYDEFQDEQFPDDVIAGSWEALARAGPDRDNLVYGEFEQLGPPHRTERNKAAAR